MEDLRELEKLWEVEILSLSEHRVDLLSVDEISNRLNHHFLRFLPSLRIGPGECCLLNRFLALN